MKNLIIYLIAIMLSGSIALQKNEAPKVTPYKVIVETEDGKRFYIPNNLVDIKIPDNYKEEDWDWIA